MVRTGPLPEVKKHFGDPKDYIGGGWLAPVCK